MNKKFYYILRHKTDYVLFPISKFKCISQWSFKPQNQVKGDQAKTRQALNIEENT